MVQRARQAGRYRHGQRVEGAPLQLQVLQVLAGGHLVLHPVSPRHLQPRVVSQHADGERLVTAPVLTVVAGQLRDS